MKVYEFNKLSETQTKELFARRRSSFNDIFQTVREIMDKVKIHGDTAVREYTKRWDNVWLDELACTGKEVKDAGFGLPKDIRNAFQQASVNIEKFHREQLKYYKKVTTMPGVSCFTETRAIERVGLYIPGGKTPLPSTVLMLAIPAKLAGCKDIVMCTPARDDGKVSDAVLFAASLCGINLIFKIGGAQAIAAMGYGTESVPRVDKVFGPGNLYVTAAKMLLSIDPDGCPIDMPAGPSEVIVIADHSARADFVASDLLAQAEHATDAQAILLCTSMVKTREILKELAKQLALLPRREIASKSLDNSFGLVGASVDEAISLANNYAPEHLILNVREPERYIGSIKNAGSVFLGPYACESAGDYASGTNHTLPTHGYARSYGSLSVDSFQKKVTFQKITREGARNIGPVVAKMASIENLDGHKNAMVLRCQ